MTTYFDAESYTRTHWEVSISANMLSAVYPGAPVVFVHNNSNFFLLPLKNYKSPIHLNHFANTTATRNIKKHHHTYS